MADEKSDNGRSSNEPAELEGGTPPLANATTEELQHGSTDPHIVDWEGPDDPANPR